MPENFADIAKRDIAAIGDKLEASIESWKGSEGEKRGVIELQISELQEQQKSLNDRLADAARVHVPGIEVGKNAEKGKFSFARMIQLVAGVAKESDPEYGYEVEAGRETMKSFDALDPKFKAAINAASDAGGAYLVADTVMDELIPELEANSIASQLGVRTLTGLQGNVRWTRDEGGITAAYIDSEAEETGAQSVNTFSAVELRPHVLAAFVPLTWGMLTQPASALEPWIRSRIAKKVALRKDLSIFEGDGENSEPTGILNTAGVATLATQPDWASDSLVAVNGVADFLAALAEADALDMQGNLGWAMEPGVVTSLSKIVDADRYPLFLGRQIPPVMRVNGLGGFPLFESSQLTNDQVFFGDFSTVIDANWGTMAFASSSETETNFRQLRTTIRGVMAHDVGVLQPSAMVQDVVDTTV